MTVPPFSNVPSVLTRKHFCISWYCSNPCWNQNGLRSETYKTGSRVCLAGCFGSPVMLLTRQDRRKRFILLVTRYGLFISNYWPPLFKVFFLPVARQSGRYVLYVANEPLPSRNLQLSAPAISALSVSESETFWSSSIDIFSRIGSRCSL